MTNATSISFGLLVALLAILLLYKTRKLRPGVTVRITEDVPGLRINHISTENLLLRVWQVAASGGVTSRTLPERASLRHINEINSGGDL